MPLCKARQQSSNASRMKQTGPSVRMPVCTIIYAVISAYFIQQATSKNYFLVFWARDFVPTKVLESPEYLVYCGLFKTHCWDKRSVQNPKGEFLEVPNNITYLQFP